MSHLEAKRPKEREYQSGTEKRSTRTLFSCAWKGFALSIWIPVIAWYQASSHLRSSGLFDAVAKAHKLDPLLWLFDFVPLGFGVLSGFFCARMKRLEFDLDRIENKLLDQERDNVVDQARLEVRRKELDRLTELHKASARRFEELFQGLPVACFTYDRNAIVYECNREFERLTGWEACRVQLQPIFQTIMKDADQAAFQQFIDQVFSGESVHNIEIAHRIQSGQLKWFLCSSFPLRASDDTIVGAIFAMVDITMRKEMEQQIAEQVERLNVYARELQERSSQLELVNSRLTTLASTDGLTGVANRRLFRERLELECAVSREAGSPLTVVLLDVDHFKDFNDSFGHQAGDDVLRKFADILSQSVRLNDVVARYGGEEFVLLLPGMGKDVAILAAERIRATIEGHDFGHRSVMASLGVATARGGAVDPRVLLEYADAALYASKRAGRNRVTHWEDMEHDKDIEAA